jgi:hypothetical protein
VSDAILKLVAIAEAQGLKFERGRWSRADVYWCYQGMPTQVRDFGFSDLSLEYLNRPEGPWMAAHEGFFDRAKRVAIVFEMRN